VPRRPAWLQIVILLFGTLAERVPRLMDSMFCFSVSSPPKAAKNNNSFVSNIENCREKLKIELLPLTGSLIWIHVPFLGASALFHVYCAHREERKQGNPEPSSLCVPLRPSPRVRTLSETLLFLTTDESITEQSAGGKPMQTMRAYYSGTGLCLSFSPVHGSIWGHRERQHETVAPVF
jgi:hypothetical protein